MSVVLFIVILLVLIVGHELGHFVLAKLAGMRVPEFGVGFPPKLWGVKWGETEYTVNALPFGGFVKIVGEDSEDQSDPNAFGKKSKWAQAATLVAGPFANIVLGFLAFWVAFSIGVPSVMTDSSGVVEDPRVVIADVLPESPAALAGLKPGDQVVAVGHGDEVVTVTKSEDIPAAIGTTTAPLLMIIERDSVQDVLQITPITGLIENDPGRLGIGIASVAVGTKTLTVWAAFVEALKQTGTGLVAVAVGLFTLIGNALTFSASLADVSGPVGIASLVRDATVFGAGQVLVLAAVISLNLAVLNLLPFPALDGGRLAMLGYEVVRGKRIRQATTQIINAVGFLVLITLMLVVTFNDIVRLI